MSDRARRARACLVALTTELLVEIEDLEHRLTEALALLDELKCEDCHGSKVDRITRLACAFCARIDALRPDERAPL